jgi:hypothetical protein
MNLNGIRPTGKNTCPVCDGDLEPECVPTEAGVYTFGDVRSMAQYTTKKDV